MTRHLFAGALLLSIGSAHSVIVPITIVVVMFAIEMHALRHVHLDDGYGG